MVVTENYEWSDSRTICQTPDGFDKLSPTGVRRVDIVWTLRATLKAVQLGNMHLEMALSSADHVRARYLLLKPIKEFGSVDAGDALSLCNCLQAFFALQPRFHPARIWTVEDNRLVAELYAFDNRDPLFNEYWQSLDEEKFRELKHSRATIAKALARPKRDDLTTFLSLWRFRAGYRKLRELEPGTVQPFRPDEKTCLSFLLSAKVADLSKDDTETLSRCISAVESYNLRLIPPSVEMRTWSQGDLEIAFKVFNSSLILPEVFHKYREEVTQDEFTTYICGAYDRPESTKDQPTMSNAVSAKYTSDFVALPSYDTLRNEAKASLERAAWNTAARKVAELIRGAAVAKLASSGDPRREDIALLLKTDEGLALVSAIAGYAVLFSPKLANNPQVYRLASVMRSDAAECLTGAIADFVFDPIAEAFSAIVAELPPVADENVEEPK